MIETAFEFNYRVTIRAKKTADEEWNHWPSLDGNTSVTCEDGKDFCSWFLVSKIEQLEYNMYDVAIEILDSPDLNLLEHIPINFRIAYVST